MSPPRRATALNRYAVKKLLLLLHYFCFPFYFLRNFIPKGEKYEWMISIITIILRYQNIHVRHADIDLRCTRLQLIQIMLKYKTWVSNHISNGKHLVIFIICHRGSTAASFEFAPVCRSARYLEEKTSQTWASIYAAPPAAWLLWWVILFRHLIPQLISLRNGKCRASYTDGRYSLTWL